MSKEFYPKNVLEILTGLSSEKFEVVPIVPTEKALGDKINRLRPSDYEVKGCYQSAYRTVSHLMGDNVKYVEGYIMTQGVPIHHAWCKIGETYFDPLVDFVFEGESIASTYISMIELDYFELIDLVMIDQTYGPNIPKYVNKLKINK